jgi:hypothetical protein|tara:strand:- start:392 stop:598 length:207 start_codon:yes stop_codon:yes gene_type:complete
MRLPTPGSNFDQRAETQRNLLIEQADDLNRKKNQDIELRNERLILQSPDGTRFKLQVDNSGNLSASSI